MRNAIVVFVAIMMMAGCVDIDITQPQIEEEQVADTMPMIVLSPATTPITWVHSREYTKNTVTFFAPADAHLLSFDVISDTPEVVSITNSGLVRYDDPYCGVQCTTTTYLHGHRKVWPSEDLIHLAERPQGDRTLHGHRRSARVTVHRSRAAKSPATDIVGGGASFFIL